MSSLAPSPVLRLPGLLTRKCFCYSLFEHSSHPIFTARLMLVVLILAPLFWGHPSMSLSYLFSLCFSHASRVGRTRNNDADVVSPESPSPQYVTAFQHICPSTDISISSKSSTPYKKHPKASSQKRPASMWVLLTALLSWLYNLNIVQWVFWGRRVGQWLWTGAPFSFQEASQAVSIV